MAICWLSFPRCASELTVTLLCLAHFCVKLSVDALPHGGQHSHTSEAAYIICHSRCIIIIPYLLSLLDCEHLEGRE